MSHPRRIPPQFSYWQRHAFGNTNTNNSVLPSQPSAGNAPRHTYSRRNDDTARTGYGQVKSRNSPQTSGPMKATVQVKAPSTTSTSSAQATGYAGNSVLARKPEYSSTSSSSVDKWRNGATTKATPRPAHPSGSSKTATTRPASTNQFSRQRSASLSNISVPPESQALDSGRRQEKPGRQPPPPYSLPASCTTKGSAKAVVRDNVTKPVERSSPSPRSEPQGSGSGSGQVSSARRRHSEKKQQSGSNESQRHSSRPSTPHRNSSTGMTSALEWGDPSAASTLRRSGSLSDISDRLRDADEALRVLRQSERLQNQYHHPDKNVNVAVISHTSQYNPSPTSHHSNSSSPVAARASHVGRESPSLPRRGSIGSSTPTRAEPARSEYLNGGRRSLSTSLTADGYTPAGRQSPSPQVESSRPVGQTGLRERPTGHRLPRSSSFSSDSRRLVGDYHGYSSSTASWSSSTSRYYPRNSALSDEHDTGVVGLVNLGNTCFMNSMIQCLSHTHNMTKAVQGASPSNSRGLAAVYKELMCRIWSKGGSKIISPNALKSAFSREYPQFSGYLQQDSQEFMRLLVDSLHDDLKTKTKAQRPNDDAPKPGGHLQKAKEYWQWFCEVNSSPLADLFMGQLRSTLTCSTCHHTSFTFDPFWDLQLPFPPTSTRHDIVSLLSCFNQYAVVEKLKKDEVNNVPFCHNCKTCTSMTKRLTLERLPSTLVIHLKRFSAFPRRKLQTPVEIPQRLDVQSFLSTDAATPSGGTVYELYATSNHIGSVYSGHYTASVKHHKSGQWYTCNDTHVSRNSQYDPTSQSVFVSKEAYVLFYQRVPS